MIKIKTFTQYGTYQELMDYIKEIILGFNLPLTETEHIPVRSEYSGFAFKLESDFKNPVTINFSGLYEGYLYINTSIGYASRKTEVLSLNFASVSDKRNYAMTIIGASNSDSDFLLACYSPSLAASSMACIGKFKTEESTDIILYGSMTFADKDKLLSINNIGFSNMKVDNPYMYIQKGYFYTSANGIQYTPKNLLCPSYVEPLKIIVVEGKKYFSLNSSLLMRIDEE